METQRPGSNQFPGQTRELIQSILRDYQHIAIVGLSENSNRPSYFAASYLIKHGYHVIPVNTNYQQVLGRTCYADLSDVPVPLEVVNIFRRSEAVEPIVDQAIALGAKVIWMQLGVINLAARQKALDAGLSVVIDRCMKIEHARFSGLMSTMGLNSRVISSSKKRL